MFIIIYFLFLLVIGIKHPYFDGLLSEEGEPVSKT